MKTSLDEIQTWVPGSHLHGKAVFDGVSTDTRTVGKGNLFVALKGENFDAHDFLPEVSGKDVAAVVAERLPEGFSLPALLVKDSRLALGEMARHWRSRFDLPVIGVTGSNGKTTVKEMIAAILRTAYGDARFLATAGNLNNDIGVPQTLFRLDDSHRAAVIELGMNHPGEIAYLAAIAEPTVGLVNNAQREHQEFMLNVEAVAKENGSVIQALPPDGVAVFPAGDAFSGLWEGYAKETGMRKILTFGFDEGASVKGQYDSGSSKLDIHIGGTAVSVQLAVIGQHNAHNALAAAACCHAIGIEAEVIGKGLESFLPVNGRLQKKVAANGARLIDDTYNANPDSVLAAIDVLAQMDSPRVLVLGDMGEVGNEGSRFHEEIGAYAREKGIDHFFVLGEQVRHAARAYGDKARYFEDVVLLTASLREVALPSATILVKGSRFMKMERVVNNLVERE
ncbi:UDP-N-acetylmuramoyl-tripeptide--D-alanyl-D-alanine ligase [Oxalobacter vibrioformis]|uniref:UDP-N-acetylmuramoyl-tripeptide--D-alanyl-D-alanine ligase n=1 Tax=Oxalobacter vibrioformis TaxID=933080 RepID=A0A9E9P3L7_9BURK|nr:UDP-N-acetylmuramoyl-tripeptide--D-alanyl-D-alanine ligase [Oxalobacter vibrioformis]WAW11127.1 UDP-N-acetylmuramoyl-tripeptide--D-alanyl-D-alanine ligase [Oxalobacter vibrioformis]